MVESIEAKITDYGDKRINPLIDQISNQQKANEIILKEFERT